MIVSPLNESAANADTINSDSSQVLTQSNCVFQSHSCFQKEGIFCGQTDYKAIHISWKPQLRLYFQ